MPNVMIQRWRNVICRIHGSRKFGKKEERMQTSKKNREKINVQNTKSRRPRLRLQLKGKYLQFLVVLDLLEESSSIEMFIKIDS